MGHRKKKIKDKGYGRVPSRILYFISAILIRIAAKVYFRASWKVDPSVYSLEGPVIVISNHPSYLDPFLVGAILLRLRVNFLAADNYFRAPVVRWLLRNVGAIPKVQFRADPTAMKAMLKVVRRGGVLGIFPEGTRSVHGRQMPVEDTFARFIKKMNAHVVAAKIRGAYLTWPRWSLSGVRRGRISVEIVPVLTSDRIREMSLEEVGAKLTETLTFDEYESQRKDPVVFRSKAPARGLHNVLHWCPRCDKMWVMDTSDCELFCTSCGNRAVMDDYGFLKPADGSCRIFESPAQWNEWQFDRLKGIVASGDFSVEDHADMHKSVKESPFLPEGKGMIRLSEKGFEFIPDVPGSSSTIFPISGIWGISSDYGLYFDLVGAENTHRFYLDNGIKTLTFSHALDILRTIP